jgi:small subunit ribosomal protein S6
LCYNTSLDIAEPKSLAISNPLPAKQDEFTTMGEFTLPQTKTDRIYESLYIVRPNLDEDAVDRTVAQVDEYIKSLGGNVISSEKKGRRRLAYAVDKMRDGYYVLTIFTAKSEVISQIKRMMTLSEDIIRYLVVIQAGEPTDTE